MALSCGLSNSDRVDGSVGWPLPSVEVRLVDTETNQVIKLGEELDKDGKERDGEIQLRGPTIFKEYWRNEKATREEHVEGDDGQGKWFKTGDVAVRRHVASAGQNSSQPWAHGAMYFIRGRKSADIIKSGGEKVSALEVERELLSLPQVAEAAVVAVPSGKWGQKVGAVVILKEDAEGKKGKWGPMDMRRALKDRLAGYKIPQVMKVVDEIPRNAMGKSKFVLQSPLCSVFGGRTVRSNTDLKQLTKRTWLRRCLLMRRVVMSYRCRCTDLDCNYILECTYRPDSHIIFSGYAACYVGLS